MQITNSILRPFFGIALLMVATIGVSGCSEKTAVPPVPVVAPTAAPVTSDQAAVPPVPAVAPEIAPATCEIVGFYGAADDGGTFVRTAKQAPVKVGDRLLVTGTGLYDGNWTVLQAFQYQDLKDRQPLWGYRIEPKWQGFPQGFTNEGGVPEPNTAKLQPLAAAEASEPM